MKATTEQAPRMRWQDLLLGLAFLAAGWANAPASLRVYAAHQRTAGGVSSIRPAVAERSAANAG